MAVENLARWTAGRKEGRKEKVRFCIALQLETQLWRLHTKFEIFFLFFLSAAAAEKEEKDRKKVDAVLQPGKNHSAAEERKFFFFFGLSS